MRRPCRWILIAAVAVAGLGCDPPQLYRPTTGGYMGAKITPKQSWTVRGSLSNLRAAADGKLATIARSDYEYAGAELILDLKEPCLFQTVIIDHGREQAGHCRKVGVATSMDGKLWVDRYAGPGTHRVTILCLPKVVLARYVRLRAITPGPQAWAVAEVFLQ